MAQKRTSDAVAIVPEAKRTRNELMPLTNKDKALMEIGVSRTSNLFAPIMQLEGHQGEIFTCEFHPDGDLLVSTGFDRQIFLWSVYGECENIAVLTGHTGAILEAHFSPDGSHLYTCSTDKTLAIWDVATAQRVRKLKGHTGFVNSIRGTRRGHQMLVSGADDSQIKLWDSRKRYAVHTFDSTYQVTAVCYNDTAETVITGGLDNDLKVWDLRKNAILYELPGHTNTITGLALSPDGSTVLSNAMDNTLRCWDIRPFAPAERCTRVFTGHQHNYEQNLLRCAWSPDGTKVSAGSADRCVHIWDVATRRVLYKLPGHNGSVNAVDFHPKEPVILSGSSDKSLYMGEVDFEA